MCRVMRTTAVKEGIQGRNRRHEMVTDRAAEGAVGEDETLAQQEEMVSFVAAAHPVGTNSRYPFGPHQ
jgi:hypothetical protein